MIYLIGSLRNPKIPEIANKLRSEGFEVFDEWFSAGKDADDHWQAYEIARGHTFKQALEGYPAWHVFNFDKEHLDRASIVVLILPAGKSGHLELGWALGQGKKGYIVYGKEPDRYDVMYRFADGVFTTVEELIDEFTKASYPISTL